MTLRNIVRAVVRGVPLRHQPIAVVEESVPEVRPELVIGPHTFDVSQLHAPVALCPFTIGLLADNSWSLGSGITPRWLVRENGPAGNILGTMDLHSAGSATIGPIRLQLFHATAGRNNCAPVLRRTWQYFIAWRHARRGALRRHDISMTATDLRCLDIYYIWARPVYVVSVAHRPGFNMFPMDLVGFVGSAGNFLLALRSTSPSVAEMLRSRRIALSSIPARFKQEIYALGAHHKQPLKDASSLPFPVSRSEAFRLPVPSVAFRIRELEIVDSQEIGSHTVFVANVATDSTVSTSAQLGHVSGMYSRYRLVIGEPLQEV